MIAQLMIAIFGVAAVYLSQSDRVDHQKWAGIFGLVGQPFWFYAAYTAQQWGIFFLSFLYTVAWGKGVYRFWIKK